MNYSKLYYTFVENFKNQQFEVGVRTEVHHILPRYAGGTDDSDNLVRVTYRQHVFLHHLWWKITGHSKAKMAFLLMSGQVEDKVFFIRQQAGRIGGAKNVESGHMKALGEMYGKQNGQRNVDSGLLEMIRPLANTPERQRKLKEMHSRFRENGHFQKFTKAGNDAWRGGNHTQEWKDTRSKLYKEMYQAPEMKLVAIARGIAAGKVKTEESRMFSESVIQSAERNEEFLHKTSSSSLNYFISPEGYVFESPIFAAGYYGNVKPHVIENWCKREHHGWKRVLKTQQS